MYGVCCFIISIIVPIVTIRYIKKNCISENKEILERMTKFSSTFLLIGNFFNDDYEDDILVWVFYIFVYGFSSLSLLMTPIIILIFLKPV